MSTSHYASRPAQEDVGSQTIRIPLASTRHTKPSIAPTIWLAVGICLLLADGVAVYRFADSIVEIVILALLTMPTGTLVILAALEVRK
jgi:hypothetical protein